MKLASSIHNSTVRIPFAFDFNLQRASPISCPKNARVQFSLRRSYPLYSGVCDCGRKYYYSTISCARKTEQEQESSASEGKTSTSPSHVGVNGVDSSENISSISNSEEKDAKTVDYASSLRTVSLCVFSAVAFGVGLGFKDGVGKASEFFAGYEHEQSTSIVYYHMKSCFCGSTQVL